MTSRTYKAISGTLAAFLQYALFIVLQLFLTPLILKFAGQEVLGAYSIIMQIIGYGILLDLGLSVAFLRFLSQSNGEDGPKDSFAEIFTIGRVVLLVTNVILAILILIFTFKIDHVISASESTLSQAIIALYFLATWTLIRTPISLYSHGLIATQNLVASNLIGIAGNFIRLIFSLALVYFGFGLIGLILANIIAEAFAFLIQRMYFKNKYPHYSFGWKVTDKKLLNKIFNFGISYWGVNLTSLFFLGSDSIVIGYLYGAKVAAVYYSTKIPAFLAFQFIFKISDNAAPAFNELFAKGEKSTLKKSYLSILKYSLLLCIPLSVGIVSFNKALISEWVGAELYAGNIMTIAIAFFVITQVLNHINAMATLTIGNMRHWSIFSICTSIISLMLSYFLGKSFGPQWVMVSIAVLDIPNLVFLFNRCLGPLGVSLRDIWMESLKPALLASLPLYALVFFIHFLNINIQSFVNLFYAVSAYVMLFIFGIVLFGVNYQERRALIDKFANHIKAK